MAVAAWLVWSRAGWDSGALALGLFALQLVLNGMWTPIFFGLKMLGVAFGEIVLLWFSILATVIAFWRITPMAGWLMVPYLGWTTFAAVLNLAIWRMNA
jgi:tryptophan-rich sensory protein